MDEEGSELARAAIFEVIENQIRDNTPPETKETLKRLMAEGQSKEEAMKLIGCALAVEIYEAMKSAQPYNESRYVANLKALPNLPWDE